MQASTPKISIVIPVYNVEQYLRECLDSVVNQAMQDIQIICVNDGSPDNSRAILQEYADRDSRIEIIDKPNGGVSSARNTAYPHIKGKYTLFVDADDWLELDLCEKTYRFAEETDAPITAFFYYGSGDQWYYNLIFPGANFHDIENKTTVIKITMEEKSPFLALGFSWNKLWRTDFLLGNDMYFPEGLGFSEDVFIQWKAVVLAERIAVLPEFLYHYRDNANSASKKCAKLWLDLVQIHTLIRHFLETSGYYPLYKDRFYKRKWHRYTNWYEQSSGKIRREFRRLIRKDITDEDRSFFRTDIGQAMPPHIIHFFERLNSGAQMGVSQKIWQEIKRSSKKIWREFKRPFRQLRNVIFSNPVSRTDLTHLSGELQNALHQSQNTLKNEITRELTRIIQRRITIALLHQKTFSKFRNIHQGQEIAIIATGPTAKNYERIAGAIHIGVNSAFQLENIDLHYLFMQDYHNVKSYIKEANRYKPEGCTKFYGLIDWLPKCFIHESEAIEAGAFRYYTDITSHREQSEFAYLIDSEPLGDFVSIVFAAIQFALWTNPRTIYLVGCDCSEGHLDEQQKDRYSRYVLPWNKFKDFSSLYYPDTKIISVNPVGLKGLFEDRYTLNGDVNTLEILSG